MSKDSLPHSISFGEDGIRDFSWPLPYSDILAVQNSLFPDLPNSIRTAGECPLADSIRAFYYKIPSRVLTAFVGYTLSQRTTPSNRVMISGPVRKPLLTFINGSAPDSHDIVQHLTSFGVGYRANIPRYARQVKWSLKWNGLNLKGAHPSGRYFDVTATQGTNGLIEGRATATSGPIRYRPAGEIFDQIPIPKIQSFDSVPTGGDLIEEIISVIRKAFSAGGTILPEHISDYFREWLKISANVVDYYVTNLARSMDLPSVIWQGSGLRETVLSSAMQRNNGEVSIHDHGGTSFLSPSTTGMSNFEFIDEFFTYNKKQAGIIRSNIDNDFLVRTSIPEIRYPDYNGQLSPPVPLRNGDIRNGALSPVENGSTIVYVAPHYLEGSFRMYSMFPPIVRLDWQYRLMSRLKDWGYEVIFQPHPESTVEIPEQFRSKLGVEISSARFESIIDRADTLLYDDFRSSTVPLSLWSDKPVTFIDFGQLEMTGELHDLLSRRVAIVDGTTTSENRMTTDWEKLASAIETAHQRGDSDYVENYFGTAYSSVDVS
jgi:hypothetical protein